jgi:uncharacterized protein YecE (DUF72 family)
VRQSLLLLGESAVEGMRTAFAMIGTAGWSIPKAQTDFFSDEGSHLHRYAQRMACVEINTSFYREHSLQTYQRWASLTPSRFRFSVKVPSSITHDQQLRRARSPLREFLCQVRGLGRKLGPLLLQLPPSLEYKDRAARSFFAMMREEFDGSVVCEPRHASWFALRANTTLSEFRIGRVATDPTTIAPARVPGGWISSPRGSGKPIAYYRWHGSPRRYWSSYESSKLRAWADEILVLPKSVKVWCIFDNTASGAALGNALELMGLLNQ